MELEDLIKIGTCVRPHGIKGGMTFHLENSADSLLKEGVKVFTFPVGKDEDLASSSETKNRNFTIEKIIFGHKVICYFSGLANREAIEALIPFSFYVKRSSFPPLQKGEYYLTDLIHSVVIDHQTDKKIGIVAKLYDHGAQTNMVVKLFSSDSRGHKDGEQQEMDIPLIDQFVLGIDHGAKVIKVRMPNFFNENKNENENEKGSGERSEKEF